VAHAGARLAAGELEGLDDALDATHREAQRAGRTDDVAMVAIMRAELLMLRGVPVPVPEAPPAPRSAVFASMWALTRVIARLRAGERTPVPEPAPHPEPRILHAIAGATGAVAAGTVARSAARAVELATAHGYRVREAEARLACADALALCGRWADVAAEARAVCELGQAMPSARFVEEGRFDAALAEPGIDPAAVERAAQLASTSPVAARRARALLGGAPPLDVVDAAVIAAVERSRGWVRPALVVPARDGGEWAPAWGLDVGRSAVWLPDGRTLDLSRRRLLFALLDALARLGGDASKEELVREVWQLRDYHPLRDDNRLHASIRKLRRALEDEPGSPARLLTTARGYALGGVVRRIA